MAAKSLYFRASLVLIFVLGVVFGFSHKAGSYQSPSVWQSVQAGQAKQGAPGGVDQASMHVEQGNSEFKNGNFEAAIRHYDEALKTDPNNVNAYNNRGVSYARMGENDRAISDFTKAIQLNPEFATAYNNRSVAYLRAEEYSRACADLKQYSRLGGKPSSEFARELESKPGGKC